MIAPDVSKVRPLPGFRLQLRYADGTEREFDAAPFLDRGTFAALRDPDAFATARAAYGGVEWAGGQSLSPDTLYFKSVPADAEPEARRQSASA